MIKSIEKNLTDNPKHYSIIVKKYWNYNYSYTKQLRRIKMQFHFFQFVTIVKIS